MISVSGARAQTIPGMKMVAKTGGMKPRANSIPSPMAEPIAVDQKLTIRGYRTLMAKYKAGAMVTTVSGGGSGIPRNRVDMTVPAAIKAENEAI